MYGKVKLSEDTMTGERYVRLQLLVRSRDTILMLFLGDESVE